jgi:hypothetical protein
MNKLPIIIGGFYRSGTTLFRRILDSHPNINCPPEIKFFKDYFDEYINDQLSHIRFFSTLRSLGISEKELFNICGNFFIKLHESAALKNGKIRWADKNTENLTHLSHWYELLHGEMLFIFIVRNPLDIMSSLNETGFPKALPQDFKTRVKIMRDFFQSGIDFINKYPEKCLMIKYEDLTTNTHNVLENVHAFIGEKYDINQVNNFLNPERGKGIEDPKIFKKRHIHSKSIGRWKNDLSNHQIRIVKKYCGRVISELGYDDFDE